MRSGERGVEALEQPLRARAASSAPRRARSRAAGRRAAGRSPRRSRRARARARLPRARSTNSVAASPRRERLEPVLVLARTRQRRAARDEHAELGRGGEHRAHRGRGVEQVLEVVEEEQQLPPAEEPGEVVASADRLRDLGGQTSSGSDSPASGTQKTPSRSVPTSSAATWSARRVFPVPPGPVSVSRRVPFESIATSSSSSRSRPTSGIETTGRFVASSVRSGGNSPSPSWIEPLWRGQVLQAVLAEVAHRGVRARGAARRLGERRSARRAPPPRCAPPDGRRCRRSPRRSRSARRCGSPCARGSGPRASALCAPRPRPRPRRPRRAKATKNASPCVSTSTPSCLANASRSARRCSARRSAYAAPCSCSSRVEPSTSVKRKVTVPVGSPPRSRRDHLGRRGECQGGRHRSRRMGRAGLEPATLGSIVRRNRCTWLPQANYPQLSPGTATPAYIGPGALEPRTDQAAALDAQLRGGGRGELAPAPSSRLMTNASQPLVGAFDHVRQAPQWADEEPRRDLPGWPADRRRTP